jgi:AP-3 complex subunit sigma
LIYRHYATLYFIFAVDASESELGILDLIQVFVEALDKCFENVCELDLIFHVDKIHHILDEIVVAGMVSDKQQQADRAAVPCPLSSFFVR